MQAEFSSAAMSTTTPILTYEPGVAPTDLSNADLAPTTPAQRTWRVGSRLLTALSAVGSPCP